MPSNLSAEGHPRATRDGVDPLNGVGDGIQANLSGEHGEPGGELNTVIIGQPILLAVPLEQFAIGHRECHRYVDLALDRRSPAFIHSFLAQAQLAVKHFTDTGEVEIRNQRQKRPGLQRQRTSPLVSKVAVGREPSTDEEKRHPRQDAEHRYDDAEDCYGDAYGDEGTEPASDSVRARVAMVAARFL